MPDELVSALLRDSNLRVLLALGTDAARKARDLTKLRQTSAELLAQGLVASALMGALQKNSSRINLQLECDGPLHGLFADADAQGNVRGYVKNRLVDVEVSSPEFRWRPALGNSGFLSVLRDLGGGEYYRSAVQLSHFELARDLEAYFEASEQLPTRALLELVPRGAEPLGTVAGLLLQPLPDGDREAFARFGRELRDERRFRAELERNPDAGAAALLRDLFPGAQLDVMARFPLSYTCSCSKERVRRALAAMGRSELESILAETGRTEVTCEFCAAKYAVEGDELRELLAGLSR